METVQYCEILHERLNGKQDFDKKKIKKDIVIEEVK